MKKIFSMVLCMLIMVSLVACGGKQTDKDVTDDASSGTATQSAESTEAEVAEWTLNGYFLDENENMISITWMEDVVDPGWYVGCLLGEDYVEDSWGGTLQQDGNVLRGSLPSSGSKDALTVTISQEGEDGVLFAIEGGETYHFKAMNLPEATIFVTINVDGFGRIDYEKGEIVPELDPEWPYQSAQVNLAEPETYTFGAAPDAGYVFVKWTKNGADYSTDPIITVLLDDTADFVAVFEEDPDWQNPVMNFIGEYQCERAHATVECIGTDEALITIEWGDSAWSLARWDVFGRLDLDTLTIEYSNCTKTYVTYGDDGEISNQEVEYYDGTGTIVFHDDGTFTWHDDQSAYGDYDMLFEWVPVE